MKVESFGAFDTVMTGENTGEIRMNTIYSSWEKYGGFF